MQVPTDSSESLMQEKALSLPRIQEAVSQKQLVKIVVVPNRLVNIVTQ
jgi:leucyl-tRNA synthetase